MPRRTTAFLEGHYYHVYNRGVDGGTVLFAPANYMYFLRLLRHNASRHSVAIVAYCLLPNHYHLVVRPGAAGDVSGLMQSLCGSYTQALNRQRNRKGPLFQSRFRSILVDREEYLIHLARYVHLNPVVAGLVTEPQAWPYSNYREVIGVRSGRLKDGTLVPGRFATPSAYRDFVEGTAFPGVEGVLKPYLLE